MALDPETRQSIIDLYRGGTKVKDIERQTSAARASIYHVLHKDGVIPDANRAGGRQKPPPLDKDLVPQLTDPRVGSTLIDSLLKRMLEQEREIGRLQGVLQAERAAR